MSDSVAPTQTHAFVVRIWAEPAADDSSDDVLWRGRVEHAASGRYGVFSSLNELLRFIQSYMHDDGLKDPQYSEGTR